MAGGTSDWKEELGRWLQPFLDRLGHKARRQMCPLYVSGLIGPGDPKSIQPMAQRLALGACDQLQPLHRRRGLGCRAAGDRTAGSSG
jgi:SRSO17 transposase